MSLKRRWLATSVTIFEILQKFPDLTYFKDINERRQDDKIRTRIRDMITETLSAAERLKLIEFHCVKKEEEIRDIFQVLFQQHQDNLGEKLENIIKLENASERIRERSRQFLQRQVTELRNAWCISTIEANDRRQMESLVRDGAADLQKLIDDIIKKGRTMTKRSATDQFQEMWEKKIDNIQENFNEQERLKQALNFVFSNYNIFEKRMLPSHDHILHNMPLVHKILQLDLIQEMAKELGNFFANQVEKDKQQALNILPQKLSTITRDTFQMYTQLNRQVLLDYLLSNHLSSFTRREYNQNCTAFRSTKESITPFFSFL